MRRSRPDREGKDGEMVELSFMSNENQRGLPCRKKRRTFLESFQTMTLKTSRDSSDDGNSSCATGGSLNAEEEDDSESLGSEEVVLSDQEKAHRAIMYQLATGKTQDQRRSDAVRDRLEHMIRLSRLKAATDDFNVEFRRDDANMMDLKSAATLKRSNSLPRNFEVSEEPPVETIEVEMSQP